MQTPVPIQTPGGAAGIPLYTDDYVREELQRLLRDQRRAGLLWSWFVVIALPYPYFAARLGASPAEALGNTIGLLALAALPALLATVKARSTTSQRMRELGVSTSEPAPWLSDPSLRAQWNFYRLRPFADWRARARSTREELRRSRVRWLTRAPRMEAEPLYVRLRAQG